MLTEPDHSQVVELYADRRREAVRVEIALAIEPVQAGPRVEPREPPALEGMHATEGEAVRLEVQLVEVIVLVRVEAVAGGERVALRPQQRHRDGRVVEQAEVVARLPRRDRLLPFDGGVRVELDAAAAHEGEVPVEPGHDPPRAGLGQQARIEPLGDLQLVRGPGPIPALHQHEAQVEVRERVLRPVGDRQLQLRARRRELAIQVERTPEELRQRATVLRQPRAERTQPRERSVDLAALELRARQRARDRRVIRMPLQVRGQHCQVGVRRRRRGRRHGPEDEAQHRQKSHCGASSEAKSPTLNHP